MAVCGAPTCVSRLDYQQHWDNDAPKEFLKGNNGMHHSLGRSQKRKLLNQKPKTNCTALEWLSDLVTQINTP